MKKKPSDIIIVMMNGYTTSYAYIEGHKDYDYSIMLPYFRKFFNNQIAYTINVYPK